MIYTICFRRDFLEPIFDLCKDFSFRIHQSTDLQWCIEKARKLNEGPTVNIHIENFEVWESPTKKWDSKKATKIYPSIIYKL